MWTSIFDAVSISEQPAKPWRATGGGRARLRIGLVWIEALSFPGALDAIAALVERGEGGAVFTPNVDHVVKAKSNVAFQEAYANASLSLVDGMPLVWLARSVGFPVEGRIAGSDLTLPLMRLAALKKWRVYLLGGGPGIAEQAARLLIDTHGVNVVGWDSPKILADGSDVEGDSVSRAAMTRPDLIIVALGAPKQELWIERGRRRLGAAVSLGLGGSLDFIVGRQKRAPRWMAASGLEWLYRMLQEPRRLWRRYLVEAPAFIPIAYNTWRANRPRK